MDNYIYVVSTIGAVRRQQSKPITYPLIEIECSAGVKIVDNDIESFRGQSSGERGEKSS
jgi:hypothetical protein